MQKVTINSETLKNRRIILFMVLLLLPLALFAQIEQVHTTMMSERELQRVDNISYNQKAHRRNVKTPQEFEGTTYQKMYPKKHYSNDRYDNGNRYDRMHNAHRRRAIVQRPYRHTKEGWKLAYKYDRAFFYDKYGYHYGYFNKHGYSFEDVFYRYDRAYTYRDRVKGRGLFGRRYYMPYEAKRYGFCR